MLTGAYCAVGDYTPCASCWGGKVGKRTIAVVRGGQLLLAATGTTWKKVCPPLPQFFRRVILNHSLEKTIVCGGEHLTTAFACGEVDRLSATADSGHLRWGNGLVRKSGRDLARAA